MFAMPPIEHIWTVQPALGVLAVGVAGLLIYAAATDIWRFRIANWINGGLLILFVVAAAGSESANFALMTHVAAAGATLIAGIILFALRAIGGGDAKLAAAVALWLGPATLTFLIVMGIVGGLLGLGLWALRHATTGLWPAAADRVPRVLTQGAGVPYGVAIAAAGLLVLPMSPIFPL